MKKQLLLALVLSTSSIGLAVAADAAPTPKAQYAAATKEAAGRYADDKKLCAEESTSSARMQCLRDAKTEYRKTLAAAKVTLKEASPTHATVKETSPAKPMAAAVVCQDCGKVIAVKVVDKEGESTPLGLIAGGVAGAVLGHQVGQGKGKDLATIAGAAGGAYAGHKVEQNVRSTKSWIVTVHMDGGEERNFNFDKDPGLAAGDLVKLAGDGVVRR